MDPFFKFLSENPVLAWVLSIAILALIYVALKQGRPISAGKFKVGEPPKNVDWERDLQGSVDRGDFPEALKGILASNLADKLSNLPEQPDTLLAVQKSGQWLAERLAKRLARKPAIIRVEKEIRPERAGEYLEIPMKGLKKRPNLYIAHKKMAQSSGNMVIVDDFVDGGGTVLSILDQLKTRNKNVKAVATIAVGKTNLDELQDSLKASAVELVYLLTAPRFYHSE
jgi:hypoxanthine phosphoribosyltransferase